MAETMSRESERRLWGVLEGVADSVNDGLTPDAAIEKAARAADLPRGHLGLVVAAYNTGRTTRQREDGETPAEKAADFDLASHAGVLGRLFPDAVKTAAGRERESGVSAEYGRPPTWYTGRPACGAAALEKAAAALPPRPAAEPAGSEEWRLRKAASDRDRAGRAVAEAGLRVTAHYDALTGHFAALRDYFKAAGSLAVADVRANVAALHGPAGAAVLDQLVRVTPALAKAAASPAQARHSTRDHPAPYALVKAAVDESVALLGAGVARDALAAGVASARPFVQPHPGTSVLGWGAPSSASGSPPPASSTEKAGDISGGMGWALGSGAIQAVGAGLRPPEDEDLAAKTLARIATPEHEQALAAIEARAQLRDVFNDDEVLSGHDPREVADHFNRISQFAPAVSRKPLMAVPLLRKSVQQGQLDTFDASGVADTEKTLRDTQQPRPEKKGAARASGSVLE